MAGKDDRGLDLRLPWGRSEPEPEPASTPAPPPSARVVPADPDATRATDRIEPDPPPAKAATDALDLTDPRAAAFATAFAARIDERLERLERGISARLDQFEQQCEAHDAGLEARLEAIEIRFHGASDASLEAVGMLAAQMISMMQEQVSGIEVSLQARHDMLVAHLEAAVAERHDHLVAKVEAIHESTLEAMSGLASGPLVDRLLEGVVALGEVLDADLVNLRRLITEEHLGQSRPAVVLHDEASSEPDPPDGLDEQDPGFRVASLDEVQHVNDEPLR